MKQLLEHEGALVDPTMEFRGTVLIVAPHMDDEVLACGGLIARLPKKECVHAVLATDGTKSPSPIIPLLDAVSPDLSQIRMDESRKALALLGLPEQNVHFLGLPEARLRRHYSELRRMLLDIIERVKPAAVLIPFRFDRHPDHLAVNHAITEAHDQGRLPGVSLYEYFVYYRWRLLPGRDLRSYIHPKYLIRIDTARVSEQKRKALDCYTSQTTKFSAWQTRPILTSILLDEVSQNPEIFLRYDPALPGVKVFTRATLWIQLVHRIEPTLKKWRYLSGAVLQRAWTRKT